jgi:hypothetical protein
MNSGGRKIVGASVKLTDGEGSVRVVYTNTFGYYRFEDVPVGQTIIFDVRAKRYSFTQPTQVVSLSEETINVNFTAY